MDDDDDDDDDDDGGDDDDDDDDGDGDELKECLTFRTDSAFALFVSVHWGCWLMTG